MRNMFNDLMMILCLADMMVILSNLILSAQTLFPQNEIISIIYPLSDGLCHVAISVSVFMTITITFERFSAISSPFTYQIRLTRRGYWRSIFCYVCPVIIASVLLNLPKVLQSGRLLSSLSTYQEKDLIKAGIIYQVFHPLLTTCILPIIILSILNYKVFKISKQRLSSFTRMTFEVTMAKIMITIVLIFIILNIPRVFMSLYEVSTIPTLLECYDRQCPYHISSMRWLLDSIIRYLVMLNSSINFIIYCFMGSNFRKNLHKLVSMQCQYYED